MRRDTPKTVRVHCGVVTAGAKPSRCCTLPGPLHRRLLGIISSTIRANPADKSVLIQPFYYIVRRVALGRDSRSRRPFPRLARLGSRRAFLCFGRGCRSRTFPRLASWPPGWFRPYFICWIRSETLRVREDPSPMCIFVEIEHKPHQSTAELVVRISFALSDSEFLGFPVHKCLNHCQRKD
jgi:hypothetical protein